MSRRASTGSYLASSGDDIGKPYQVYAEIVNAGKNVTGILCNQYCNAQLFHCFVLTYRNKEEN